GLYDNFYISVAGVPLLGDYNDNAFVDAADYVMWRKGGPLQNESETVGSNTPEDYVYWRSHFGAPAAGAGSLLSSGAPEPSSLSVFLMGATIAVFARRRPRLLGSLDKTRCAELHNAARSGGKVMSA